MANRTIILECDEDDYRDIQAEIARCQELAHRNPLSDGSPCYPDGESNVAAICVGEAVRSLWEYRALYEIDHPRGEQP